MLVIAELSSPMRDLFASPSILAGWKPAPPAAAIHQVASAASLSMPADIQDALHQIVALRQALRDKQLEIDVLVEALAYGRSIEG